MTELKNRVAGKMSALLPPLLPHDDVEHLKIIPYVLNTRYEDIPQFQLERSKVKSDWFALNPKDFTLVQLQEEGNTVLNTKLYTVLAYTIEDLKADILDTDDLVAIEREVYIKPLKTVCDTGTCHSLWVVQEMVDLTLMNIAVSMPVNGELIYVGNVYLNTKELAALIKHDDIVLTASCMIPKRIANIIMAHNNVIERRAYKTKENKNEKE